MGDIGNYFIKLGDRDVFGITIAGELPKQEALIQQLNAIIEGIEQDLGGKEVYFSASPACTGEGWLPWIAEGGRNVQVFGAVCPPWTDLCKDDTERELLPRTRAIELLCDCADLVIAVWNENTEEMDGATWDLLRTVQRRQVPCIWISSLSCRVCVPDRSLFGTFDSARLSAFCRAHRNAALEPQHIRTEHVPLLKLGHRLYRRYLKKYRASGRVMNAKEDLLMREDYEGSVSAEGNAVRRKLLATFAQFDRSAIELNERYQTVLYWRAILPLITTVCIAVGFYATSLLAALPLPISPNVWSVVGAVGFFIFALLNLYVFYLSKNKTIRSWHQGFLRDRYVAELLRVLVHFVPFGVQLDLHKLCVFEADGYAAVRTKIGDEQVPPPTEAQIDEAFEHIDALLSDQIAYHTASQQRYEKITRRLEQWSSGVFYAGFALVLFRAALQIVLTFVKLPQGTIHGVALQTFVSSLFNALALLVPAWCGYFTGKLSLCNFRYNRDNHARMRKQLLHDREALASLRADGAPLNRDLLRAVGESLADDLLLQDTAAWARTFADRRVTHL